MVSIYQESSSWFGVDASYWVLVPFGSGSGMEQLSSTEKPLCRGKAQSLELNRQRANGSYCQHRFKHLKDHMKHAIGDIWHILL